MSQTKFVRRAIEDRADLSEFRQRPSWRVIAGVGAILFSYIIGWPLIGGLGAAAVYWKEPLLVAIGGPVAYGLSHLVFLLGMYLAGAKYSLVIFRWATRVTVERFGYAARPDAAAGKAKSD